MSEAPDGRRLSRKEQRRLALERETRSRTLRLIIPIAVLLLAFVAFVAYRVFRPDVEGVVKVVNMPGGIHDDNLQLGFGGLPPTGGPHASSWQKCGIYTEAVLSQHAIHSMEHGAVWITYHPDLPADQITTLQDIVRGQTKLLLSPYPDQDSPVVLTVWDRQLQLEHADDSRVEQFIGRYRNQVGPETYANCSDGIGNPVG